MNLIIGSHVSYLKNSQLLGSVEEALKYGENTFMFYTGSNQSSERFDIDDNLTFSAHMLMKENGINPLNVVVHAPFIINLANNKDDRKYNFYISFLNQELQRCKTLGIPSLVLHPGSAVGLTKEEAINNISFGINEALKNLDDVNILLEYMSGKGTEIGSSIDELSSIYNKIDKKNQVHICLDTCHMNDSGIDIGKIDEFLDEFDSKIGIDKIKCFHINDSLNPLGSHKDRHANLGYGTIGFDNLLNVIYHSKLKDVPKILETPHINRNSKDDYAPYKEEIENIKNKTFKDFINL